MNRRERRRVEALLNDRAATAADRAFFARRPDRHYRVRRAFPAEREANARVNHERPREGEAAFVAVGRDASGVSRVLFFAPRGFETDLSEADAGELFRLVVTLPAGWVVP